MALAGCNVFDYLIEGSRVTAVDLNAAQIALTELKAKACQILPFEAYFDIFAKNKINLLKAKYEKELRPLLSARSQKFWDSHIKTCVPLLHLESLPVVPKSRIAEDRHSTGTPAHAFIHKLSLTKRCYRCDPCDLSCCCHVNHLLVTLGYRSMP